MDDNNASHANVGPGGLTSADEFSVDGSRKGGKIKPRFQHTDYSEVIDKATIGSAETGK